MPEEIEMKNASVFRETHEAVREFARNNRIQTAKAYQLLVKYGMEVTQKALDEFSKEVDNGS